ncbi:hypothetical protein [Ruegeria sp. HKCCC2117]|uniref:hypothetical protein n=1 Tax=Ruegeria sp. HKCCC2117 TaxID=2682992 RepID=UPI001C2CB60F|nr:hypothetical protein [Ruegeria sp. HKCCC2117]
MGKVKESLPDRFRKLRLQNGDTFYLAKGKRVKITTKGRVREGFCLYVDPDNDYAVVEFQKGYPNRITASIPMIFAVGTRLDVKGDTVWSITAKDQSGLARKKRGNKS